MLALIPFRFNTQKNHIKLVWNIILKIIFYSKKTKENPLHYCASQGNVPVLVALLASIRPTDLQRVVNKQNVLGRSPLQLAAKNGHLQCVLLFLQNQVKENILHR